MPVIARPSLDSVEAGAPAHSVRKDRLRLPSVTRKSQLAPKPDKVVNPVININQKIREVLLGYKARFGQLSPLVSTTQDVDSASADSIAAGAPESHSLEDGELLPPEGALDLLAQRLHSEVEHINPMSTVPWTELDEGTKEAYRTCVEGLLLDWDLIKKARVSVAPSKFVISPATTSNSGVPANANNVIPSTANNLSARDATSQ